MFQFAHVNLPEGHIPSLGEKHHAATGCRTQVYSPLVIIIHLLYQFLQNEPDGKKHVERLGLKVAYHRNHGMYIYVCVCMCDYIYMYVYYVYAAT